MRSVKIVYQYCNYINIVEFLIKNCYSLLLVKLFFFNKNQCMVKGLFIFIFTLV